MALVARNNQKKQEYYYAADVDRNGIVEMVDAIAIRNHYLGSINIDEMYND